MRSLWLLAVLAVCATYGAVIRPAEATIAQSAAHARLLYDEANQDDAKIERSAELAVVKARVDADVRRLRGEDSSGVATAAALRLVADEGKRFHVEVRSVTPESSPTRVGTNGSPSGPVEGEGWTLGFRASFREVVALLADLPRHDVLIDVTDVDLNNNTADRGSVPRLDATVHATVFRLRSAVKDEHVTIPTR